MKFDNDKDFAKAFHSEIENRTDHNFLEVNNAVQDVILERAAARFDPKEVCVKGGYAVRTVIKDSPYTQDIDILLDKKDWQKLGRSEAAQEKFVNYIYDAMEANNQDRITFKSTGWYEFSEGGATEPIVKVTFSASLKGRLIGSIQVDAGLKPDGVPTELHKGRDLLNFAEVENPVISTVSKEYLIADKVTLLLSEGHDRPRDHVHAALLLDSDVDSKQVLKHAKSLAKVRGVEQRLQEPLELTNDMESRIERVCTRNGLKLTARECVEKVNDFLDRINDRDKTQVRIIDASESREGPEGPKQARGSTKTPNSRDLARSKNQAERADAHTEAPRSSPGKQIPSGREISQYSRNELPKVQIDRPAIDKGPGINRPSPGLERGGPGIERGTGPAEGGRGSSGPSGSSGASGRGFGGFKPGREGGFNPGGGEHGR